jgi:hypothetical protein
LASIISKAEWRCASTSARSFAWKSWKPSKPSFATSRVTVGSLTPALRARLVAVPKPENG